MTVFYLSLFLFIGLLLIAVILLQRGRGGGLVGAFGGGGGQSAFGTKTGDVFTTVTVITFAVFLILALLLNWRLKPPHFAVATTLPAAASSTAAGGAGALKTKSNTHTPGAASAKTPAAPGHKAAALPTTGHMNAAPTPAAKTTPTHATPAAPAVHASHGALNSRGAAAPAVKAPRQLPATGIKNLTTVKPHSPPSVSPGGPASGQ